MVNSGSTGHHWHLSDEAKKHHSEALKGKPQKFEHRKKRGLAIRIGKEKHRTLIPPNYYEQTKSILIRLGLQTINELNELTDNSNLLRNGVLELLITRAHILNSIYPILTFLDGFNTSCTSHNVKSMSDEFMHEVIKNAVDRHLENLKVEKDEELPSSSETIDNEQSKNSQRRK